MMLISALLLLISILNYGDCLIPRVCSDNASLPMAVCCPSSQNPVQVCGGPKRGVCQNVILGRNQETAKDIINKNLKNDDRINWPLRFYTFTCSCLHHFSGIACEKCKSGWSGENCDIHTPKKKRQNVLKLSDYERFILRSVVNISKYTMSEYLIINSTSTSNCDPITPEKIQLLNASVYDVMVFIHFYSSRSTISKDVMESCSMNDNVLDFAHKGPAFFTWHRYYLLWFEDLLSEIAIEQFGIYNFSLPYWDWTNQTSCVICTDDLFGSISLDQETVNNSFFNWKPMCPQNPKDVGCHICDPSTEQPSLWREYSKTVNRLPKQEEVDELLSVNNYDLEPYNSNSYSRKSFRNFAEGFIRLDSSSSDPVMERFSKSVEDSNIFMHNMVHSFINGTWMDLTTSPNDPIFLLHHTFMDKIFELWLLKNFNKKFPKTQSVPIGHHSDDYLVPFLPLVKNKNIFKPSVEFGYIYDDNYLGTTLFTTSNLENTESHNLSTYIIVLITLFAFGVIVCGLCYICYDRRCGNRYSSLEYGRHFSKKIMALVC